MIKNINKRFLAGVMAGVIAISLCSCRKQKKVSVDISNSTSLSSTLNSVSNLTKVDENLKKFNYVCDDGTEYSFEELVNKYHEARLGEYVGEANLMLYRLGNMILQASVAEELGIDVNSISYVDGGIVDHNTGVCKLHVRYDKTIVEDIPGGFQVENIETVSEDYDCGDEVVKLLINMDRARVSGWKIEGSTGSMNTDIDDAYKAFERYLLSSGRVEEDVFGDPNFVMSLDANKVAAYEKIK